MTTTSPQELKAFLSEAAAERLAILQRLEAGARVVGHYDFNNTYQYVINRQETHLQWLQNALAEFEMPLPPASSTIEVPPVQKSKKVEPSAYRGVLEDDANRLAGFVQKWRPRVESMTHARHRQMMNVIIGESQEHQRLFAQAAGGFEDVLGKRTERAARVGEVLPSRWQE